MGGQSPAADPYYALIPVAYDNFYKKVLHRTSNISTLLKDQIRPFKSDLRSFTFIQIFFCGAVRLSKKSTNNIKGK